MVLLDEKEDKMLTNYLAGNRPPGEDDEEEEWIDMECYVFNPRLPPHLDDSRCVHCGKYLTLQCPHIGEMMDEVDD